MKLISSMVLIAAGLALQADAQGSSKSSHADLIGAALVIVDPQVDLQLLKRGAAMFTARGLSPAVLPFTFHRRTQMQSQPSQKEISQ